MERICFKFFLSHSYLKDFTGFSFDTLTTKIDIVINAISMTIQEVNKNDQIFISILYAKD